MINQHIITKYICIDEETGDFVKITLYCEKKDKFLINIRIHIFYKDNEAILQGFAEILLVEIIKIEKKFWGARQNIIWKHPKNELEMDLTYITPSDFEEKDLKTQFENWVDALALD